MILPAVVIAGVIQMVAMRRSAWVLALFLPGALMVAACGDSGQPKLTLVVAGTAGLQYKGEWARPNEGMSYDGVRLSDTGTPTVYEVKGPIISLKFQKQVEEGLLRVEIRDTGNVIVRLETQAPYGVVAIGTPVSQ